MGGTGYVTHLAKGVLSSADRVVVVSRTSHSVRRAEVIARATHPLAPIRRVVLNILVHAHVQRVSLVEMSSSEAALDVGEVVALVSWDDSYPWSVFTDIATAHTKEPSSEPVEMMSGITSYQALAAVTGAALTRAGGTLTMDDGVVVGETLGSFSRHLEGPESWLARPLSHLATVVVPAERTSS